MSLKKSLDFIRFFSNRMGRRGLSLLESLLALGMLSVVSVSAVALSIQLQNMNKLQGDKASLESISTFLKASIENQAAWDYTKGKNSPMSCAKTFPYSCATGAESKISLYNSEGKLLTDITKQNVGFKADGDICYTFDTGDFGCIYRAEVSWRLACSTTQSCQYPDEQVAIKFFYKGDQKINLKQFEVAFTSRINFGPNASPIVVCSRRDGFFIGYGQSAADAAGNLIGADSYGCIPRTVLSGPVGPPGGDGSPGPSGAAGLDGKVITGSSGGGGGSGGGSGGGGGSAPSCHADQGKSCTYNSSYSSYIRGADCAEVENSANAWRPNVNTNRRMTCSIFRPCVRLPGESIINGKPSNYEIGVMCIIHDNPGSINCNGNCVP